jgi:hypothetical protein
MMVVFMVMVQNREGSILSVIIARIGDREDGGEKHRHTYKS